MCTVFVTFTGLSLPLLTFSCTNVSERATWLANPQSELTSLPRLTVRAPSSARASPRASSLALSLHHSSHFSSGTLDSAQPARSSLTFRTPSVAIAEPLLFFAQPPTCPLQRPWSPFNWYRDRPNLFTNSHEHPSSSLSSSSPLPLDRKVSVAELRVEDLQAEVLTRSRMHYSFFEIISYPSIAFAPLPLLTNTIIPFTSHPRPPLLGFLHCEFHRISVQRAHAQLH